MYFSTRIFTPVFHANSKLVALGIMAIGIPFNFVPGLLPSVRSSLISVYTHLPPFPSPPLLLPPFSS